MCEKKGIRNICIFVKEGNYEIEMGLGDEEFRLEENSEKYTCRVKEERGQRQKA